MIKTMQFKTEDTEYLENQNGSITPTKSKSIITITITENHLPKQKDIYKKMLNDLCSLLLEY